MKLIRTNSENQDFIQLVKMLDEYLAYVDGDDHAFYDQFNKIDALQHCIVIFEDENPVGCGAIKPYDKTSAELKRMFVIPEFRGKGYASKIVSELERWAKELGYEKVILETGINQLDAIRLYEKTYERMENYGQYNGVENSLCFIKELK
ncbi:GNAT family N-acetyltransferase [Kaistella faecalis]|uniref:GNAT family N-acetyltransferase n=1 Tax=Kaistella faecalis TaxID=2852098 RepID=UPI001B57812D|nr:GNAT family N-acetyltransferase [Chryseobacterium faecale]MBP3839878.1 GNAT family N-acetyltransferase [Chryseobacterium sp.]UFK96709.1 GNAT family N-acetyltransferase [Chryseobacterium faecale]